MAVKVILVILLALSGCDSYNSMDLPDNCSTDRKRISFNLECRFEASDSKQHSIKIYTIEPTLHITHNDGWVLFDLDIFPKWNINEKLHSIKMENCTLPSDQSLGTLFEHFGVKDEILAFEGINIAQSSLSLGGRFSSGFEKVENLTLHWNSIGQLNENVFRLLTKLYNLDLSKNEISDVDHNAFRDLVELRTLKMSSNKLKSLKEGMFERQKHLNLLCLRQNSLPNLTKEMFRGLDSLSILTLEKNKFSSLMDNVFHNLPSLKEISLGNSNLPYTIFVKQSHLKFVFLEKVKISEGLLLSGLKKLHIRSSKVVTISGLSNIETVSIIRCELHPSALTSFKNLRFTKELNLSFNGISNLDDGIFDGLKELVRLQLSKNLLTNISGLVFRDLKKLIEIDLSYNNLSTIHPDAFVNTDQLTTINLQNNQLSFSDNKMPFMHLYHLKTLNLSNNNLARMPSDLNKLKNLKEIDLTYNQITSVKFSEIRQNSINISSTYETRSALGSKDTRTYLSGNPLDCDCSMFEFLSRTDQEQLAQVFNDTCLKHHFHMTGCSHENYVSDQCPTGCNCIKLENRSGVQIIISCKDKQLTRLPEIKFMNATSIELDISNNSLTELPILPTSFNVTFIQASFNQISEIKVENLPSNLRGLDLSRNNVRTIAAKVIDHLRNHQSLEILLLKDNPLACHCSDDMVKLIDFIEDSSMTDLQEAKCNVHYQLSQEGLQKKCEEESTMYILIFVTILTLMSAVILVLVMKHNQFIKMWLYAHDWFLWWVDEEYVDRHKVYDIFISYTNENRMLAYRITYALEKCNIFKVCLHERDFVGGERIEQSVRDAVNKSRRTLVILTEDYMQSEWCEHEFHLAWERSVAEKRQLIIAVKAGNLGHIADETIHSYIKTHTYIEVDDQWFWERLIFRLPHKKMIKNIFPIREYETMMKVISANEDESANEGEFVNEAEYANEGESVQESDL
ncbi:protein toll-like [Bradysia coprophila]|uniref:protein toll-like n=1 Tax=Bradysia coprophila TaxID=38358 RepID=UPI00187DBD27|nr:protein toll-like [Bradysia coprophila]